MLAKAKRVMVGLGVSGVLAAGAVVAGGATANAAANDCAVVVDTADGAFHCFGVGYTGTYLLNTVDVAYVDGNAGWVRIYPAGQPGQFVYVDGYMAFNPHVLLTQVCDPVPGNTC